MSGKNYNWKRFWCRRSDYVKLDDYGYLSNPDLKLVRLHNLNPDLVNLETVANVPCLVLLGEPGIGKSQELNNLRDFTKEKICDSSQILELNLRSCTNLREDLFKDETFTDWLEGDDSLYLFLDSLDEGLLNVNTLATGLIDELKKQKYRNHIDRLHLRLACRTSVFPATLEKGLGDLWQEYKLQIYQLVPLRRIDVIEAAKAEKLISDDFLNDIERDNIVPLAIKPITLKFLVNTYRRHNGQFPQQKIHEFYLEGCKLLCEEMNDSRKNSGHRGDFDSDQRLIVAARIAAITIFANRLAVWTEADQGDIPDEDVHYQKLCFSNEKANENQFEIKRKVIEEVLDTGLFSYRGSNRMGWEHQTYAEFLAAWYLVEHELSLDKIKDLLYSSEHSEQKLIPQLHETAAWLSTMRPDVLQEIIKTDPNVLLQTDIPTDSGVRASIVDSLLTQYQEGKLFDRSIKNHHHYRKLNHPGLVEQLRSYICDPNKEIDARNLAIDIAEVCKLSLLKEELLNLALDSAQSIRLRVNATRTLCSIGDQQTISELRPLFIEQILKDEDDQLRGFALKALWPNHLTVEELFQGLTRPKKMNCLGEYQWFLDYGLVPKLEPNHLLVALDWLKTQSVRCSGHPFAQFGDKLLFKAWENLDFPGVAAKFTEVALIQWKDYQKIIAVDIQLQEQFASSLLHDTEKRHTLAKQSVLCVSSTTEKPLFLLSSLTESILVREDISWMLEQLEASSCEKAQKIWSELVMWIFDRQNVEHISSIVVTTKTNSILQKTFSDLLMPVELNSLEAEELRANYLKSEEIRALRTPLTPLNPPPKERVLVLLDKLEFGDLLAWWILNREMTLKPKSRAYGSGLELDLTKLPGWQDADKFTQSRIIEGAKKYVLEKEDVNYDWIGTNNSHPVSLAGYRALILLSIKSPDFLQNLSPEIWQRWTPIILGAPNANQHLELNQYAYRNAPEKFIQTVSELIDKESQHRNDLAIIRRLDGCWNERLLLMLLDKANDHHLTPKCTGQLIEILIDQGLSQAENFAQSLICFPLPLDKHEREKAFIAAKILFIKSEPSIWSFLWTFIQEPSFGREVLKLVMDRYPFGGIKMNLTEAQLADLYIWLVHDYPYDKDPDHTNDVMAHNVTTRESIAELRDSILWQLKERGTPEACNQIQRITEEFSNITWLHKTLIDAQVNMRRKTWQPMKPEELLRFIITLQPSNSNLLDNIEKINRRTERMEKEPKIDQSTTNNNNFQNSNVSGNINIGEGSIANNTNPTDTEQPRATQKRINWTLVLTFIGLFLALIGIFASGLFNDEIKQFLFSPNENPPTEQNHQQ